MRTLQNALIALLVASSLAVWADDSTKTPAAGAKEVAVMDTTDGQLVIEFWTDAAPKTIANFKKLASSGFYNGTAFHRIIKDFMIQGGDPLTKDAGSPEAFGTGGPGYTIEDEFNDHSHQRGVLSMANTGAPNSAGSQFFICTGDDSRLDHHYTAFGKVIKGDDVLEKLASTPVERSPHGELSSPTQRVEIKTIKIVPADSVK